MAEPREPPPVTYAVIAALDGSNLLIEITYAADFCALRDYEIIGWRVDVAGGTAPEPVVVGLVPAAASGKPPWARVRGSMVEVPDSFRGSLADFFTWLATTSAQQLAGDFIHAATMNAFAVWSRQNPGLVFAG